MDYYEVQDPYGMSNQYYKDHFLCIWEVLEDEIVGHWEWEDLAANERWYEEIIMPAFKAHDARMKMKSLDDEILGLSSAMSKTSLADVSPNARQIRSESNTWSDNSKYFSEHCFCDSDEETNAADDVFKHYGEYDSCSDTDDEVEEANAVDDSIKRLGNGF
ncbi:hypothetical protein DIS24_g10263 [Lasiodiplodia hormozganensis]|uniref:Uncharacterized protein n=1 Tax=Lasiodiplodia hormozganensis TaxID=869390 RepID=A0AA39XRB2_9PEZI|nr:hypothetical protein DIS24_g10263 [Lasiodiplodia hormozganensis]